MLWIKALHVIAVIAWMAGMLYLPRLFVYHADAPKGSALSETFKIMERRLLKAIINPAMVVVWLTGPYLAYQEGYVAAPWLHAKLALVLVLSADARIFRPPGQDFRRRREYEAGAVLSLPQRGSDPADDRHRDSGRRQAVLRAGRASIGIFASAGEWRINDR